MIDHTTCCCAETIDDLRALEAAYKAALHGIAVANRDFDEVTGRLNDAIAERDRARDTAARLEAELARGFRTAAPDITLSRTNDGAPGTPDMAVPGPSVAALGRPGSALAIRLEAEAAQPYLPAQMPEAVPREDQEGAESGPSRVAESDAGAPALLWVDVETTGLDPSRDAILEIAAIVTDSRGREIGDPLHAVIKHDPEDVARMRAACPEAVRSMHDASGLWSPLPEGEPWREIAARLTATIAAHGPSRTLRIAGSSVRLDAAFIERYAPTAAALLHYRIVDVSSLAFVAREMGWVEGAFPKGSAHRALADIRESLAEYRWLCGLIGRHKSTSADLVAGVEMPPADADDDAEWTPARRSSGPGVGWQVSEATASEAMARLERIGVNFADPQDAAADATDGMSRAERALAVKRQPPAWAGLTDRNLGRRR